MGHVICHAPFKLGISEFDLSGKAT